MRNDPAVIEAYLGHGQAPQVRRRRAARMTEAAPDERASSSSSAGHTFYGPSRFISICSLKCRRGQIVCLLGGNASGKSTTMKVILGLVKPALRRCAPRRRAITGLPTPQLIRRGLGSVPEARRLFGAMTVRENVLMGAFTRNDRAEIAQDYERMLTLFPRLAERRQPARPARCPAASSRWSRWRAR